MYLRKIEFKHNSFEIAMTEEHCLSSLIEGRKKNTHGLSRRLRFPFTQSLVASMFFLSKPSSAMNASFWVVDMFSINFPAV